MSCCSPNDPCSSNEPNDGTMRNKVREGYAKIAEGGEACDFVIGADRSAIGSAGCCAPATNADFLATSIGYNQEELKELPEGANMGLSCGNPATIAGLQEGETVVDLGSGGGFDCFLCGPKVGASGKVIGIDMTQEMLEKARKNLKVYQERTELDNVEFRLGEIEHLPVADESVDTVISNCVINLSTEKEQVWKEAARVLKPGGRISASDIALLKPLPDLVQGMVENWIGCVAGAVTVDEYRSHIEKAGLKVDTIRPKPEYVKTLMDGNDPFYLQIADRLPKGEGPENFITSIDVLAVKEE